MRSRKNKQPSTKTASVSRTNGDDLRRALDWIVNDEMFADLRVHGNVGWSAAALVRLAVFWVWSAESSLVVAADEAIACMKRIFGQSPVGSYQGMTNALCRYSDKLLNVLFARMQSLMQTCDPDGFRIGRWVLLAVDGSRLSVPRTLKNQRRFCKSKGTAKRRKKSKSRKRTKSQFRRRKENQRPDGPLIWLTLIWHVGQRLPWRWKIGPAYSSERHHMMEMLNEQQFPENTLFCADGGYIGNDFWRVIERSNLEV